MSALVAESRISTRTAGSSKGVVVEELGDDGRRSSQVETRRMQNAGCWMQCCRNVAIPEVSSSSSSGWWCGDDEAKQGRREEAR